MESSINLSANQVYGWWSITLRVKELEDIVTTRNQVALKDTDDFDIEYTTHKDLKGKILKAWNKDMIEESMKDLIILRLQSTMEKCPYNDYVVLKKTYNKEEATKLPSHHWTPEELTKGMKIFKNDDKIVKQFSYKAKGNQVKVRFYDRLAVRESVTLSVKNDCMTLYAKPPAIRQVNFKIQNGYERK